MTNRLAINPEQHDLLMAICKEYLPEVAVWAFGSRVKNSARSNSDLDLVVFVDISQRSKVFALQEALEESNLPFRVDLLIWDEIPKQFKDNILGEYLELLP